MKGITPVVAVILLLLVTIAVVGFAFGFFQRIFGLAGTGVENQTSAIIQRAAQTVGIDNVNATAVVVRNAGTADINANAEVTVFLGAAKATCGWSAAAITPGGTATCHWSPAACAPGTTVKVVAPGNEATRAC